jgi:hypothetical protein
MTCFSTTTLPSTQTWNDPGVPTASSVLTPSSFSSAAAARAARGLYPQELQYVIFTMGS